MSQTDPELSRVLVLSGRPAEWRRRQRSAVQAGGQRPPVVLVVPPERLPVELPQALSAGVRAFAAESDGEAALQAAATAAAEGRLYASPSLATALLRCLLESRPEAGGGSAGRGVEGLSRREAEVALEALHGVSYSSVARQLFIGTNTVKTHLRRIYRKLGIAGISGLAPFEEELRSRLAAAPAADEK